jgi:hypothetical protein
MEKKKLLIMLIDYKKKLPLLNLILKEILEWLVQIRIEKIP